MDLKSAIVMNEAQFPEFIHEHADPGPRCPNHLCQCLMRYFRKRFLRLVLLAMACEQVQSPRQPFLRGVEDLVD